MKRARIYSFVFVAVIVGVVAIDLYLHDRLQTELGKEAQKAEIKKQKDFEQKVANDVKADALASQDVSQAAELADFEGVQVSEDFKQQLLMEVAEIGKPQSDIESIENRLSSFARHLDQNEVNYLARLIAQASTSGDLKAMALDLLGRNQSSEALKSLKNFAIQDLNSESFNPRSMQVRRELEAMQAQAIEEIASARTSLEALNHLQEIKNKTPNAFLRDRTERSILAFKGLVPSTEVQDQKALEEILEQ